MRSGEKDAGRGRRQKRARERERETEGERGAALAVHITLLTIRGQCHRVRPAAPLHFTWLHLAPPSRFSPACALRLLVLPPSRRVAPPSSHTRPLLSLSLSPTPSLLRPLAPLSQYTRARDRSPAPRVFPPAAVPLPSSSFHPQPFPLFLYRRLLSRASTSSSPAPSFLPFVVRVLVLLLLPVPPRPPPPSILIDRSCTRAQRSASSSYRLVSSPSTRSLFSFLFLAFFFFFFLFPLSFFLPALLPPPFPPSFSSCLSPSLPIALVRYLSHHSTPCSRARTRRSINYSKNSYCYYYRLTIPSAGARDGHSSPVQCATLFAPRRLRRQPDGGDSADGDDESWTSGTSSVVPAGETRIDFTRVTFFL